MPPTDNNNFFGIKVSKFGVPVQNATDNELVYKDDFSTKTYFDSTTARIVEGLLPDGSYGMWVSKPGFDVRTASGDQLIFNSSQNIFKILLDATYTLNTSTTSGVIRTIAHNLGFLPVAMVYLELPASIFGGSSAASTMLPWSNGGTNNPLIEWYVDNTNLYLTSTKDTSGNSPYTIHYYLLQETAISLS